MATINLREAFEHTTNAIKALHGMIEQRDAEAQLMLAAIESLMENQKALAAALRQHTRKKGAHE